MGSGLLGGESLSLRQIVGKASNAEDGSRRRLGWRWDCRGNGCEGDSRTSRQGSRVAVIDQDYILDQFEPATATLVLFREELQDEDVFYVTSYVGTGRSRRAMLTARALNLVPHLLSSWTRRPEMRSSFIS